MPESLFLIKLKNRLWHSCFPVNFAKFLRKLYLPEKLRWLLLWVVMPQVYKRLAGINLIDRKQNLSKFISTRWWYKHLKMIDRWTKYYAVYTVDMIFLLKIVFHWQSIITYIFSVCLKFGACCIMGQWDEFRPMKAAVSEHIFLGLFTCFLSTKICLNYIYFCFWWSIKFLQQNINHSETGIGDKKLPVELYITGKLINEIDSIFVYHLNNKK